MSPDFDSPLRLTEAECDQLRRQFKPHRASDQADRSSQQIKDYGYVVGEYAYRNGIAIVTRDSKEALSRA